MLIPILFGLFGLIIGSFLNVVIIRHATRSLAGRSGCLSCGARIRARDLIPIISWVFLRGRCRSCGSRISIQYPLVEISTAVLFGLLAGAHVMPLVMLISCSIMSLFVMIAAYDIRHTIIPDEWVYSAAALALVSALMQGAYPLSLTLLAGPIAALPLFALWVVSRGRWMGLGDAKLALAIGWLLGPVYGIYAVFFAFVVGAVISVVILLPMPQYISMLRQAGIVRGLVRSSYTMKSEVPFGPFLILACFIVWFSLWYQLPLPGAFF